MRIVLCYPVESRHVAQIQQIVPKASVLDAGQEGIAREIMTADIFCGHAKVPMPWEDVVQQGRLRWIQSSAAGLDHCLVPSVIESDIPVTSASGVLSDQVAEHTLMLATSLTRNMATFFRQQQAHEYVRRPTRDLTHSTVGIVGFGAVGRRVAEVLAPFKTRILATDVYPIDKPSYVQELWPAERLDELLPLVDMLILCLPLNDQTRWLFNREKLQRMKRGALLLNMARGKLVVEEDLVAALEYGPLSAAAADVAAEEPLSPTSKLWDLPNMLITPHVAGQSARRIDNMTNFFCENLRRYQTGEPLLNLVDKRLGFPIRRAGEQTTLKTTRE
ncbi:MAG: D-2-hydroxyacid dehydrogenase [Pirellulales bacterium]|nr:D-2-hydroxyacid dehydrogenase [Pirellulales bacterium]